MSFTNLKHKYIVFALTLIIILFYTLVYYNLISLVFIYKAFVFVYFTGKIQSFQWKYMQSEIVCDLMWL